MSPLAEQFQIGRVVGEGIIQRGQGIGAVRGLREDLQLVLGRVEVINDGVPQAFTVLTQPRRRGRLLIISRSQLLANISSQHSYLAANRQGIAFTPRRMF